MDSFRYLGAFLEVDWTSFLSWVYNPQEEFYYPLNDVIDVIAPPNILEVITNWDLRYFSGSLLLGPALESWRGWYRKSSILEDSQHVHQGHWASTQEKIGTGQLLPCCKCSSRSLHVRQLLNVTKTYLTTLTLGKSWMQQLARLLMTIKLWTAPW